MPYNTNATNFGLLAAFDARQWAGVDVVRYNATDVSLPSYATGGEYMKMASSSSMGEGWRRHTS